jgi:ABC-2 type transport system ATP-binding protein
VTLAREHGKTILVSTHVLRDVQSICDRLVLLVRGRVRLAGSIADLTGAAAAELRLRGSGPLADLVDRLVARGIAARLADDAGGVVFHAERTAIPTVWEEVRATGVAVHSLEPERRPLEDVFLAVLAAAEAEAGRSLHAPA